MSADKPLIVPARDAELVEGNWEKCNSGLREKDLEIVTIRQLAELRMRHGKGSEYCVNGSWVGEGIVYMPNGKVIILPRGNNLLIKNPTTVLNAHKNGNEFYIYDYAQIESNPDFLILERGNIPSEISVGKL